MSAARGGERLEHRRAKLIAMCMCCTRKENIQDGDYKFHEVPQRGLADLQGGDEDGKLAFSGRCTHPMWRLFSLGSMSLLYFLCIR